MFRLGMPILTYHKLGPRPDNVRIKGLYMAESYFKKQLRTLRENRFPSLTLDDVARDNLPPGSGVVLTFDDAYDNVFRYGLPHLVNEGFCAIQFIVVNLIGKTNEWDVAEGEAMERLMDEGQIREWLQEGQMIGSHTLSHPWLSKIDGNLAREEIYASKARLEDKFGVAVEHFCYPYGDWAPAVVEHVRSAGYKTACTVMNGINLPETPKHTLRRFTARYPSRNLKAWWNRLRGW